MNLTTKITKLQLANLVYSPISWGVLLALALYSGILFTDQAGRMTQNYLQMPQESQFTWQLVEYLGFIQKIKNLLFLFIPLLGMGLISNEINSGTIKLLYSSPIKIRSIVLGKFWAMAIFNVFVFVILLLIGVGASFFIDHIDWGIVLSFCIGIYILSCTYSAVSLFMSSLTGYQIISAILTIALLYGLDYLGEIETAMPVIRDLLPWLAISTHARNILTGYFISSDVLYFVLIMMLFLYATILKMNADRLTNKEKVTVKWKVLLAMSTFVGVMYLVNLPKFKFYFDATAVNRHTLSTYGVDMLQRFEGKELELELVDNAIQTINLRPDYLAGTLRSYENYARFKPDLKISASWYYDTPKYDYFEGKYKDISVHEKMDLVAKYHGYERDKIPFINELSEAKQSWIQKSTAYSGMLTAFNYNGESHGVLGGSRDDAAIVPTAIDDFTAITQFFEPAHKVTFLQGNKERQINRGWETDWTRMASKVGHRFSLINNGFEVEGIDIQTTSIHKDTDIVVVADPMIDYTTDDLSKIKSYIDTGENMLIAIDTASARHIKPLLKLIDVQVLGQINTDATRGNPLTTEVHFSKNASKELTTFTSDKFNLESAYALEYSGNTFKALSVIETDKEYSWLKQDSLKTKQIFTTTLTLTRKVNNTEQRILITGDADLLADRTLMKNVNTTFNDVNTNVFKGYFYWLTSGIYPINMKLFPTVGADKTLTTSYEKMTVFKVIYIGLIPLLIALMGAFIWFKRSRK